MEPPCITINSSDEPMQIESESESLLQPHMANIRNIEEDDDGEEGQELSENYELHPLNQVDIFAQMQAQVYNAD